MGNLLKTPIDYDRPVIYTVTPTYFTFGKDNKEYVCKNHGLSKAEILKAFKSNKKFPFSYLFDDVPGLKVKLVSVKTSGNDVVFSIKYTPDNTGKLSYTLESLVYRTEDGFWKHTRAGDSPLIGKNKKNQKIYAYVLANDVKGSQ